MLIICAKVSSGYSYSMGYIWLHEYSKLPNKHAARLSIFQCFSYHHALIWQYIKSPNIFTYTVIWTHRLLSSLLRVYA